ncbi:hypothetical protein HPP92_004522 [Vanilla planifolia]|uniref:Uncharacterized protein n=1 Tax=Vanilla planifolia TaxID=51239 RepID=A0A835S4K1_VANPL|nr:hypothetical protein HPP92_004522 [Vanilla planifolia]
MDSGTSFGIEFGVQTDSEPNQREKHFSRCRRLLTAALSAPSAMGATAEPDRVRPSRPAPSRRARQPPTR